MPDNSIIEILIVVFLGVLLGSFSTAVVYRTRQSESWIWNRGRENKARSFCPSCDHVLSARDLIPILSWLLQKGRCRYCAVKIPVEYIALEVMLLLVCLLLYTLLGFNGLGLSLMLLAPFVVSQVLLLVKYRVLSTLLISIIIIGVFVVVFL